MKQRRMIRIFFLLPCSAFDPSTFFSDPKALSWLEQGEHEHIPVEFRQTQETHYDPCSGLLHPQNWSSGLRMLPRTLCRSSSQGIFDEKVHPAETWVWCPAKGPGKLVLCFNVSLSIYIKVLSSVVHHKARSIKISIFPVSFPTVTYSLRQYAMLKKYLLNEYT